MATVINAQKKGDSFVCISDGVNVRKGPGTTYPVCELSLAVLEESGGMPHKGETQKQQLFKGYGTQLTHIEYLGRKENDYLYVNCYEEVEGFGGEGWVSSKFLKPQCDVCKGNPVYIQNGKKIVCNHCKGKGYVDLGTQAQSKIPSNNSGRYAQNVIGEETYYNYRLQRYSDGTSKIFDEDQNWIQFYTEYKKDKYTGEITNNPIEIQRFLGESEDEWLPDIFGADIRTNDGFSLKMTNGNIVFRSPDSCSVIVDNFVIKHDPYPFEGKTEEDIQEEKTFYLKHKINRNGYIPKVIFTYFIEHEHQSCINSLTNEAKKAIGTNYTIMGPMNNPLTKVELKDKQIPREWYSEYASRDASGYYDNYSHKIYTLFDIPFQVLSIKDGTDVKSIMGDDIVVVNCLVTDTITKFIYTDKICEIYYSNGDYLKYSRLVGNGEIYDCRLHRPDGVFTIKIENEHPVARFEYTKGDFAGYTYINEDADSKAHRILGRKQLINLEDGCEFYNTKTKKIAKYDKGSLWDPETKKYVVLRGQKKKELEEQKAQKAQEEKKLQPLYQKYGKQYVDAIFKQGKILVGTPEGLVRNHTNSELISETQTTRTYKIGGMFRDWASTVVVSKKTKKVLSVKNWT